MLVSGRHPAERVMVGDEGGAVGVAEAVQIAGVVVIISDVAALAAHGGKRRRALPERVVPARHPLAVDAVEPRHGLQAERMVIVVIDVAAVDGGEAGALGDDLADHPVEIEVRCAACCWGGGSSPIEVFVSQDCYAK
jgi:hypothetical protein